MEREILFRGKAVDGSGWVYGAYLKHLIHTKNPLAGRPYEDSDYQHIILNSGFSDWNMPKPIDMHEVDPATVSQFTGQIDKDAVKIFENDIIEQKLQPIPFVAFVVWSDLHTAFRNVPISRHKQTIDQVDLANVKVIGNLIDNNELMKEQTINEDAEAK